MTALSILELVRVTEDTDARGALDNVPVARVKEWQTGFLRAFNTQFSNIANAITESNALSDESDAGLKNALATYNASWS